MLFVCASVSRGDEHIRTESMLEFLTLTHLLHHVRSNRDCTVSCRNWIGHKVEICISPHSLLKLQTTHGYIGKEDILAFGHGLDVLIATVVRQHVNQFHDFAHPERVHIEHLVLVSQGHVRTDGKV